MRIIGYLKWLWLVLLLTACATLTTLPPSAIVIPVEATATNDATPTPERSADLGTSPPPAPTATPMPTNTPEPPGTLIAPIATAPMLRFESWSPDSAVLAYWTLTEAEKKQFWMGYPLGTLNFFDTRTSQACAYPRPVEGLTWVANSQVIVVEGGQARLGTPCQDVFVAVTQAPPPPLSGVDSQASPKGTYRVEGRLEESSGGVLSVVTTIIKTATGQIENIIHWHLPERLGMGEGAPGGVWLTDDVYLIPETVDEGPLLLQVGQPPIAIASELFGLPAPCPVLSCETFWLAIGNTRSDTDTYHILLTAAGVEADLPNIHLYHSESDEVEELPFRYFWSPGFSQNGRWLLLSERPTVNNYETYELWTRSVDPPASKARPIALDITPYTQWSADWTRLALSFQFRQPGRIWSSWSEVVSALSFPEGKRLRTWVTRYYSLTPISWSPNNSWLVIRGDLAGENTEGLFVVSVP